MLKRTVLILLVLALALQLGGCSAIAKFFRHPFSFWQDHPEDEEHLVIPDDLTDTGALAPLTEDTGVVVAGPAAAAADSAALAAAETGTETEAATAAAPPAAAAETRPAAAARPTANNRPGTTAARPAPAPARPAPTTSFRTVNHTAFRAGERLTYAVSYLGITAGHFTMQVNETNYNGRPCYQVVSEARSASGIEWMYRMRDRLVSYIDRAGLFSWRYEKHIDESSDRKTEIFEFDQRAHRLKKPDGGTEDIPAYCQDVLSAMYYVRAQNLQVGSTFTIPCYDGRKLYDMVVRVLKLEVITVSGTQMPCLLVTPLLKFQGAFRSRGQINMWVTNDHRHIPVKLESRIAVGAFTAELTRVEYTR